MEIYLAPCVFYWHVTLYKKVCSNWLGFYDSVLWPWCHILQDLGICFSRHVPRTGQLSIKLGHSECQLWETRSDNGRQLPYPGRRLYNVIPLHQITVARGTVHSLAGYYYNKFNRMKLNKSQQIVQTLYISMSHFPSNTYQAPLLLSWFDFNFRVQPFRNDCVISSHTWLNLRLLIYAWKKINSR